MPILTNKITNILSVEDHPVNQVIFSELLEGMNCYVDTESDGLAALERVKKTRYDLIFMDIQMPVMDGLEATRIIRQSPGYKSIPIIAVSASSFIAHGDKASYTEFGFNDWLLKPYNADRLKRIIKRWTHQADTLPESTPDQPKAIIRSLNPETIASLRKLYPSDNPVGFNQLISATIDTFDRLFEELQTAISGQDRPAITRLSHGVKSISGNLGASRLLTASGDLENRANLQEFSEFHRMTNRMTIEYSQVRQELTQLLTRTDDLSSP
ncbi:MAG: response regulator [Immundisolibacteraceae bacterium]|nr:response regulator [Immundisolibacteraceae bacterium]